MSCENCKEAFDIDRDVPDCETGKGCPIPPLDERGKRIVEIREKLVKLKGLVDPGTILAMYGATIDELDLLAKVEETMNALKPGEDNA